jgi:hypothetical protein
MGKKTATGFNLLRFFIEDIFIPDDLCAPGGAPVPNLANQIKKGAQRLVR